MNIAIVDTQLNYGGGMRFLTNLCLSLRKNHSDCRITIWCNKEKLQETGSLELFYKHEIKIEQLVQPTLKKSFGVKVRSYIKAKLKVRKLSYGDRLRSQISTISSQYDLIFFPWPFFVEPTELFCPSVATFHDFNFMYFFGVPIFSSEQLNFLKRTIPIWLENTHPVVSTNFMKEEVIKFYPFVDNVDVVHLSSLNHHQEALICSIPFPKFDYFVNGQFILCPIHATSHKNIANIISAAAVVNKVKNVKFVFVGSGSQIINGHAEELALNTAFSNGEVQNIIGLGYVSDEEMNYLLLKSIAVLNASFYEAGNGIGLDAWAAGVAVIQSNILPFAEHLVMQGYDAFTFDPKDYRDMASSILECLNNDEMRKTKIAKSLTASQKNNWQITASKYYDIFTQVINLNK